MMKMVESKRPHKKRDPNWMKGVVIDGEETKRLNDGRLHLRYPDEEDVGDGKESKR